MQDTELYRHVLGLERPWKVDRVELDIRGGRVDVWAVHEEGLRWACPECRTELAIYDHAPERIWRHLDTCQFKTFLHARVPLMTHMGKAVDEVRKAEHRELMQNDDERLKGTKYPWLYSKENVPKEKTGWLRGLRQMNLRTARAWAIKENFRELWRFFRRSWAEKNFKAWFFWATHSKLAPVITAAWTFKRHLSQILNYVRHRITNAVSEGLNSKIQTIKKKAYGFRNRENFKTSIFFHCCSLNLYPVTHKNV